MIGERTDSLSPIAFYKLGQFIYYKGDERNIDSRHRQLLRGRHEILDFKDGAILHGDCLPVRNDGGECGGMPHHRIPLGIELEGRGMDVAICQTAAHHGVLRRIHHLLYLHERGGGIDEGGKLPLYDALSLRKSGAGTYRRSRRTLSGEDYRIKDFGEQKEEEPGLPRKKTGEWKKEEPGLSHKIQKIVFHQMKK